MGLSARGPVRADVAVRLSRRISRASSTDSIRRASACIADWVPAHFPSDPHGLARFDGTALYEHADPRLGLHKDWDTLIYNFGRREVANFLEANALFWLEQYHIDGLRVDAVASMLYLDYSREPGEWVPNVHGGRENLEAVAFVRGMNTRVYGAHPGILTGSGGSTAWPAGVAPVDHGGLGFGYKWNMGWMHDTLKYIERDPIHRVHHHNDLTFGLLYAFSENFILPLSHDEVVSGKRLSVRQDARRPLAEVRQPACLSRVHVDASGKEARCSWAGEFAQEREWNHDYSLDWNLSRMRAHRGVQKPRSRSEPPLSPLAGSRTSSIASLEGFEWIDASDAAQSVLAFLRRGRKERAAGAHSLQLHARGSATATASACRRGGRWIECLNSDA